MLMMQMTLQREERKRPAKKAIVPRLFPLAVQIRKVRSIPKVSTTLRARERACVCV